MCTVPASSLCSNAVASPRLWSWKRGCYGWAAGHWIPLEWKPLNISMGGQDDWNVAEKMIVTNGRSGRRTRTEQPDLSTPPPLSASIPFSLFFFAGSNTTSLFLSSSWLSLFPTVSWNFSDWVRVLFEDGRSSKFIKLRSGSMNT